jgi:hypothetical protein
MIFARIGLVQESDDATMAGLYVSVALPVD